MFNVFVHVYIHFVYIYFRRFMVGVGDVQRYI